MKEPRPQDSRLPREARPAPVLVPQDDLDAQMAELRKREAELQARRDGLRRQVWDRLTADGKALVQRAMDHAFDLTALAKACGFTVSSTAKPKRSGGGPTTLEGWIATFRTSAVQSYFRRNPSAAQELKTKSVPPSEWINHVPAEILKQIDIDARSKAEKRFSQVAK